jgi:hypothetical protein
VEWTDRADDYVRAVAEATDDWSIADTGERGETITLPGWTVATRAMRWAQRALWSRGLQPIIATLRTGPKHTLLEPGDVVTVTHSEVDLRDVRMRVRAISEAPDRTYTVDLVEEPSAILRWPSVAVQSTALTDPSSGRTIVTGDTLVVPFEVPAEIPTPWADVPVIGVAVAGVSSGWLGTNIYLSRDGTTYTQVAGVRGGTSIGALTTALPEAPVSGLYDDAHGEVTVDFSPSMGSATTQTREEMLSLSQLAVVGDELVSWQQATLVGSYTYRLRGMMRGVYDTEPASHAAQALMAVIGPAPMLAVPGSVARGVVMFPARREDAGRTLYLKCPAVTAWLVEQDITSVQAIAFALQGLTVQPDPPSGVQLFGDGLAVTDQRTLTLAWRYRQQGNVEDIELQSGTLLGTAADFATYVVELAIAPSSAGPWTVATTVAITSEQLVWHTASTGYVRVDVTIRDTQGDLSPVRRRVFKVI